MASARNKTINIQLDCGKKYLKNCLTDIKGLSYKNLLNKTICANALEVMPLLPKNFVDLMIVDPPYNLSKNYNGNKFSKCNDQDYEKFTLSWVEKSIPLLKKNASLYVCCDWKSSLIIGRVLSKYFLIQNRITWQREKGRGAKANWKNGMEDIWFVTKSADYTFNLETVKIRRKVIAPYRINGKPKDWQETPFGNFRDTCPSNFWDDISIPYWSMAENTAHPTQKPEKLLAKLILASSQKGDVVFDPFLGSGTTSVVAKKLERKFLGIEQNPLYCVWAQKRLETAETDDKIQGYSDGVFWERNTHGEQKRITEKEEDYELNLFTAEF